MKFANEIHKKCEKYARLLLVNKERLLLSGVLCEYLVQHALNGG